MKHKLKISKFLEHSSNCWRKIGVKRGQNFLSTLSLSPVLARRAEAAGSDLFIGNSTRRLSIHHRLSHPSRPISFSLLHNRTSETSSSSSRRSATPPPTVARRRATSTRSPLLRSSSPPTQPPSELLLDVPQLLGPAIATQTHRSAASDTHRRRLLSAHAGAPPPAVSAPTYMGNGFL